MGYDLKSGKTYTIPQDGTIDSAYAVLLYPVPNKHSKETGLHMGIYKSKTDKDDGKQPYETFNIHVGSSDFDTYYGPSVLNQSGKNVYERSYVAIDTLMQAEIDDYDGGNTESRNGIRKGFVWKDWESDE